MIMQIVQSRAIVAEEQDFYSAGLAAMLEHDVGFNCVLQTKSLAHLNKLLAQHQTVDFLALDLALPGVSGTDTIRDLRVRFPGMRLVAFSTCSDRNEILSTLAAGAHGFIPKNADRAELRRALRIVKSGGVFVPPTLAEAGPVCNYDATCAHASATLTERQRQVVELLSEGCANKVIARELGISPSTVKVHVHAAFRALGVHSRIGAVAALRPPRYG